MVHCKGWHDVQTLKFRPARRARVTDSRANRLLGPAPSLRAAMGPIGPAECEER